MAIGSVMVAGSGTMGRDIAATFARAGLPTTVLTRDASRRPPLAEGILVRDTLPAAAPDLIVEAVPEDMAVKRALFAALRDRYGARPILASNTSGLPLPELAAGLPAPQRFLGIHYYQPADVLPMVEVARIDETAEEVLAEVLAVLAATGRRAIVVRRPITGFLVNRLQHALLHEALHLIEQDIATAADIDAAARWLLGPRMAATGLLEQKDLGGLAVVAAAQRSIVPALHHGAAPSPVLQDKVARGEVGAASGRGFYDWRDRDVAAHAAGRRALLARILGLLAEAGPP